MKISRPIFLLIAILISQTAYSRRHDLSIRTIDFANFTFPYVAGLDSRHRTFTLTDGEIKESKRQIGMYLAQVSYGDVTGDGIEEAFVRIGIEAGGSAMPNCLYIYKLDGNHPTLLWSFDTGDRANGGLRKIYSENGTLVVELYGKGTPISGSLYGTENAAACCAKSVTRTRYRWTGTRFRQTGKSEIFQNPAPNSSPVS